MHIYPIYCSNFETAYGWMCMGAWLSPPPCGKSCLPMTSCMYPLLSGESLGMRLGNIHPRYNMYTILCRAVSRQCRVSALLDTFSWISLRLQTQIKLWTLHQNCRLHLCMCNHLCQNKSTNCSENNCPKWQKYPGTRRACWRMKEMSIIILIEYYL